MISEKYIIILLYNNIIVYLSIKFIANNLNLLNQLMVNRLIY